MISTDPFADAAKGDEEGVQDGLVHIRIQQRNGRKTLTTIQGLSKEYDLKKIVKSCKKVKIKNLLWFSRLSEFRFYEQINILALNQGNLKCNESMTRAEE